MKSASFRITYKS